MPDKSKDGLNQARLCVATSTSRCDKSETEKIVPSREKLRTGVAEVEWATSDTDEANREPKQHMPDANAKNSSCAFTLDVKKLPECAESRTIRLKPKYVKLWGNEGVPVRAASRQSIRDPQYDIPDMGSEEPRPERLCKDIEMPK